MRSGIIVAMSYDRTSITFFCPYNPSYLPYCRFLLLLPPLPFTCARALSNHCLPSIVLLVCIHLIVSYVSEPVRTISAWWVAGLTINRLRAGQWFEANAIEHRLIQAYADDEGENENVAVFLLRIAWDQPNFSTIVVNEKSCFFFCTALGAWSCLLG